METRVFENVVALDSQRHSAYRLKPSKNFVFAKNVLSAPLALSEVIKASREYPIFFPTSGRFLPVAQMGYRKDGNLYLDEDNKWKARYIPAHVRRFPFVLGEKQDAGEYLIMVAEDRISKNADGELLFEDGSIPVGGAVDQARTFLTNFQKELMKTEELLKPLKEYDILEQKVYKIEENGKLLGTVKDLLVVNPEKLYALDDLTLAAWVRSGLMGIVMAHLHSLDNWDSLNKA
jgi:hypothetical protein